MEKRKRVFIAVMGVAVVVAVFGVCLPPAEPRYHGRSLSSWLEDPDNFISDGFDPSAAGVLAVRELGTNAIPTLLQWISYEPSPIRQKVNKLLQKLPGPLKPRNAQIGWSRANNAAAGFAMLGSEAQVAAPALVRLALTSSDPNRAQRCIDCLFKMGPEGLLGMCSLITNSQALKQTSAIYRICDMGTNAVPAVPALIKCLEDNDDEVAHAATVVLGELALLPTTTVPALQKALQTANTHRRAWLVSAFYRFGGAAKPAVPQLVAALVDSSSDVRFRATNILLHIAPEALTNVAAP